MSIWKTVGPSILVLLQCFAFRLSEFLTFTSEEIEKMSCKRITNLNTFDSLLHPNPGGLLDPALGPCDEQELCGTYGLNYVHCPGHIGHIILPLSAFHPIFFQNFYKILRVSRFACSHFMCTQYKARVIKGQIALLDRGLVSEALELESSVSESIAESGGEHSIVERIYSYVKSCLERLSGNRKHDDVGSVCLFSKCYYEVGLGDFLMMSFFSLDILCWFQAFLKQSNYKPTKDSEVV